MEPITAAFIFILGLAIGENHKTQQEQIDKLEAKVEQLDSGFVKLAGSHSAVSARDIVNHESQENRIKFIEKIIKNSK